jgi:hypothetical protein
MTGLPRVSSPREVIFHPSPMRKGGGNFPDPFHTGALQYLAANRSRHDPNTVGFVSGFACAAFVADPRLVRLTRLVMSGALRSHASADGLGSRGIIAESIAFVRVRGLPRVIACISRSMRGHTLLETYYKPVCLSLPTAPAHANGPAGVTIMRYTICFRDSASGVETARACVAIDETLARIAGRTTPSLSRTLPRWP